MLKQINLGQYYQNKSLLHSTDCRIKIITLIIYVSLLFKVKNPFSYFLILSFLSTLIMLSKIPIKYILNSMKAVFYLIVLTSLVNLLFTKGEIILSIFILNITKEGLELTLRTAIRLMMLVLGSCIFTLTTSPINLSASLEYLMTPLKIIGVPVHDISMIISIALRFIPTISDEFHKLMNAQKCRGANFDKGSIIKKSKALLSLFIPIFISAFNRADDLAIAMESRCYRGEAGRTKLKKLKLSRTDIKSIFCLLTFLIILVWSFNL